jgi:hypothetical protein
MGFRRLLGCAGGPKGGTNLTAIESGVEIKKTTNLEHDNGFAFGPISVPKNRCGTWVALIEAQAASGFDKFNSRK